MQLTSPAAVRNLPPIIQALRPLLPASGRVLELASGPGQHVAAFAATFSKLTWQPSDVDAAAIASIDAWRHGAGRDNLRAPLQIDLADPSWGRRLAERYHAMVAINVCHIAPWAVSVGLLTGAADGLEADAPLLVYGPFLRAGHTTAPSNLAFDASLRSRDPAFGLRSLEALVEVAEAHALAFAGIDEMPANNLIVRFVRGPRGTPRTGHS